MENPHKYYLQYDSNATTHHPPNTLSFDPKTCSRSLFQTPKTSSGNTSNTVLQTISSIFLDAQVLFSGNKTTANPSATPVNATPAENNLLPAISTSPARNSPSKLPAFLRYAEDRLRIKHAMDYNIFLPIKAMAPMSSPMWRTKR